MSVDLTPNNHGMDGFGGIERVSESSSTCSGRHRLLYAPKHQSPGRVWEYQQFCSFVILCYKAMLSITVLITLRKTDNITF